MTRPAGFAKYALLVALESSIKPAGRKMLKKLFQKIKRGNFGTLFIMLYLAGVESTLLAMGPQPVVHQTVFTFDNIEFSVVARNSNNHEAVALFVTQLPPIDFRLAEGSTKSEKIQSIAMTHLTNARSISPVLPTLHIAGETRKILGQFFVKKTAIAKAAAADSVIDNQEDLKQVNHNKRRFKKFMQRGSFFTFLYSLALNTAMPGFIIVEMLALMGLTDIVVNAMTLLTGGDLDAPVSGNIVGIASESVFNIAQEHRSNEKQKIKKKVLSNSIFTAKENVPAHERVRVRASIEQNEFLEWVGDLLGRAVVDYNGNTNISAPRVDRIFEPTDSETYRRLKQKE